MTCASRPVTVKHNANNYNIAGCFQDIEISEEMSRDIKQMLNLQNINLGKVSKALRIVRDNCVFFSEEYTRMTKRIGYVVIVNIGQNTEIGIIEYFIQHHDSNTCMAVLKLFEVDEEKPLFHPFVSHLVSVKMTNRRTLVKAEQIREKVMYFNGNTNFTCVARLPNLFGQCS